MQSASPLATISVHETSRRRPSHQRDIGGQLPAAHLDGARIRQTGPFYGFPYAEIAAPFETVYVSL